jgi:hypothetical protein
MSCAVADVVTVINATATRDVANRMGFNVGGSGKAAKRAKAGPLDAADSTSA